MRFPFSENKKISWLTFERSLRIIEVMAVVGGVIFAGVQIRDWRNTQSAQLMLEFNKELASASNSQIITVIENKAPLFKEAGGYFNSTDIDNYLSVYELLNNTYEAGLITDDMLYNAFSYEVVFTYENPEIKNYITKIRKEDRLFFAGFERLAQGLQMTNTNLNKK